MPDAITVARYPLPKANEVRLLVPRGGRVLCVRTVDFVQTPQELEEAAKDAAHVWETPERPMLYIAHSIHETEKEYRTFHILANTSVSRPVTLTYLSSFEIGGGIIVFHVFESPDDQS